MKKYKAGSFNNIEEENYYTDDFIIFYKENDKKLDDKELKQWAIGLIALGHKIMKVMK